MELTPLRSAALGLAAVALVTLAISQSGRVADRLVRRHGLRPGLRQRCRTYTIVLLAAAIAMAASSTAFS